MSSAIAYFDGACLPRNPGGFATFGWVLYANKGGQPGDIIQRGHGIACRGPQASNNRGEYGGLSGAMEAALLAGVVDLIVRGDSQLIIRQMTGAYKVKAPNLIDVYREALDLASRFERIRFEWIPRDQNSVADRLSEVAYEEISGKKVNPEKPTYRPQSGGAGGAWKADAASEKQLSFLKQLGHSSGGALTKGEASKLIDSLTKQRQGQKE